MNHSQKSYLFRRVRGTILIAAIWVLVFFVILSVGVSAGISAQIRVFKKLEDLVLGVPLARSACLDIIGERRDAEKDFDTAADLARVRVFAAGNSRAEYSLADESARINLNTASAEVLARLPGLDPVLAGNMARAPRPFAVPEQARLVEGIDAKVWAQCQGYLTVYSDGKVNVNTASAEVLRALGFDEDLAGAVLDLRAGPDGVAGTDDDGHFEDAGAMAQALARERTLSDAQRSALGLLAGQLSVRASALTASIRTFITGRRGVDYTVVLDQEKIRRWSEQ